MLEEAKKALKNIAQNDITMLKSYAKPPPILDYVMQAVIILFGEDSKVIGKTVPGTTQKVKDYWEYSKKAILNSELLRRI